jgi:hypothetical protein
MMRANQGIVPTEGLEAVRADKVIQMKLTKRQIEVTMFAAGVGRFKDRKTD